MSKYVSNGLGMMAFSLLLSVTASAAPLAQQCGAVGIVTYDSIPVPTVPAGILARQCGAFGIVTYDLPPGEMTLTVAMVGTVGNVTYNGSAHKPEPTVTDPERGVALVKETDYTLSWGANTAAGSGSVTVTGKGNYTGSVTKNFTIARRNIADAVVTLGGGLTYNGQSQRQSVSSVKVGGLTVTYNVSGNTATAAGNYTLTITGTGNFTGSTTKQFTVSPKNLTAVMVGAVADVTYNGSVFKPEPTVTDLERGVPLVKGTDYTLSWGANTEVGPGSVTVTGTTNYTGTVTRNFTIKPVGTDDGPDEAFDGLPVVIEPYGEGGWIVTITNDVDAADLPIEIPDNIGNVIIDLNGHDLTGNGGALGESALPGEPAIRIVPCEGDGEPTVITIVNSGDDATVKGGEGAPAIEVAEDAQDGVRGNIGEGVTVQGGDDYTPAIIGEIGTNEGTIVEPSRIHIPGEGTVTTPKTWKSDQKVTWKATAAKGSVFAHWEGASVDLLGLSRNQLRNPSLAFAVPAGFDADAIHAVFISVDDDRLGTLTLSQLGPLAPNVDVAGLSLVDDSESYVTANMSGLPTGLKFDAKTLSITGKPTKPGVYTVKVTAKNASGYQWAENIELRVSDIEDAHIDFGGLPETGAVGTAYAGQVDAGAFKSLSASGLPAGLKMDAKTGAVAGLPTKGGYFTVTVTANYPDKTKATATRLLTISPVAATAVPKRTAYYPLTVVSANLAEGTVTGTGVYAAGKKSSISAKPAKDYVFAGWYLDQELTKPMAFSSGDFRKASQSVIVPEARYLFARFVGSTTTDDPITGLATTSKSFRWCVGVSVPDGDGVTYVSASLPTVSASGLPSGVKFDAVRGCFTGVPTKAGEYSATVTVKNASKSTASLRATFKVEALPEWAQGTFDGTVERGTGNGEQGTGEVAGLVTLTVDAKGKISGKLIDADGTWTLSAAAYERVEGLELEGLDNLDDLGNQGNLDDLVFHATVIGKNGKKAITNEVTVASEELAAAVAGQPPYRRGVVSGWTAVGPSVAAAEDSRPPEWTAWQNLWKTEPWKTGAKEYAKAPKLVIDVGTRDACPYQGTIELKFGASGAVTAKCGKDSCATVLIPAEDGTFDVFCYFVPKGEAAYAAEISLTWDAVEKKFSVAEP